MIVKRPDVIDTLKMLLLKPKESPILAPSVALAPAVVLRLMRVVVVIVALCDLVRRTLWDSIPSFCPFFGVIDPPASRGSGSGTVAFVTEGLIVDGGGVGPVRLVGLCLAVTGSLRVTFVSATISGTSLRVVDPPALQGVDGGSSAVALVARRLIVERCRRSPTNVSR
ncbi:hypothetical protein EDC04DRAFT_2750899 [Pisolithus marmoratus]|nr:hypothetical protein EDC04DRAFT_2750899 [Pisolithus marmoratus]